MKCKHKYHKLKYKLETKKDWMTRGIKIEGEYLLCEKCEKEVGLPDLK